MTDDVTTVQDETTVLVTSSLPEAIVSGQDQTVVAIQAESETVVVPDVQTSIATIYEDVTVVTIGDYGPQGPQGPQGPPGVDSEDDVAFAQRIDYILDFLIYRAEATPGALESEAKWRIRRLTIAVDDDVTTEWADGDGTFTKVWNSRQSYAYS